MPKSLSQMKSSPDVGRPERVVVICVSGKLVAELEEADSALFEIESQIEVLDAERSGLQQQIENLQESTKPRRQGEVSPAVALSDRVDKLTAKIATLDKAAGKAAGVSDSIRARMEDHTIPLHLRGKTNGEWRQWVTGHPARDEDEDPAGFLRDKRQAGGYCNIDALIADLGDYITAYGDETPSDGSWEFVQTNAAPGDLTRLASTVVGMHEQVVDLGKSRATWRADRKTSTDSE